jgi:hypothetical protein
MRHIAQYVAAVFLLSSLAAHSQVTGTGNISAFPSTVVASLPACGAGNEGTTYIITNALTPVLSSAVVGGGSIHVKVTCINGVWAVTGI